MTISQLLYHTTFASKSKEDFSNSQNFIKMTTRSLVHGDGWDKTAHFPLRSSAQGLFCEEENEAFYNRDMAKELLDKAKAILQLGGSSKYYEAIESYCMEVYKFYLLTLEFLPRSDFDEKCSQAETDCFDAYAQVAFYS